MNNESAFPTHDVNGYDHPGLTKLEYFAGLAQAAMIQRGYDNTREVIAEEAVRDAKALLAALKKGQSNAKG